MNFKNSYATPFLFAIAAAISISMLVAAISMGHIALAQNQSQPQSAGTAPPKLLSKTE
jgi:hypothetical protein